MSDLISLLKPSPSVSHRRLSPRSREIIEDNLGTISQYLDESDIVSLKLTCQPFYYYFVTSEIWDTLKIDLANEKLEDYDNVGFEETEPKAIPAKEKNIRIHSLRKQNKMSKPKNSNERTMLKVRQPSNIKEKSKAMKTSNELLFRNTEIGFKRLLRPPRPINSILDSKAEPCDLLELPGDMKAANLLISSQDAWSVNMHKTHHLTSVIKKWNQFHHQVFSRLKTQENNFESVVSNMESVSPGIRNYTAKFGGQSDHSRIVSSIEGAEKNLLIEDQLNRVSRLFLVNHSQLIKVSQQIQHVPQQLRNDNKKTIIAFQMYSGSGPEFVQMFSTLEEFVDSYASMTEAHPVLGAITSPNAIQIFLSFIYDHQSTKIEISKEHELLQTPIQTYTTQLCRIQWLHLVASPNYFQLLFEILNSICSKLLKMASMNRIEQQLTISLSLKKIKELKTLIQHIWNISKYFNKLVKQIQSRNRKMTTEKVGMKKDKKIEAIADFLKFYAQQSSESLHLPANTAKIQADMSAFRNRINELKSKMQ